MYERLEELAARYRELEQELARPEHATDPRKLRELAIELKGLRETVQAYDLWKQLRHSLEENESLLSDADAEIRELARGEISDLRERIQEVEAELRALLVPRDPNDEKNVVLEIRAGTGGEEAALFAADLFRTYSRYAERSGWKVEVLSMHSTDTGGVREVIASLSGRKVYRRLKYERGVHRVQRVPVTESAGRIHTSTVTVAVLPEAEEVDVQIDEQRDLRIDVFRSSGPGGQSVNTTDSAVRITHLPTDLVVTCQDEKSQHKNRARAMKILRSRLLDIEQRRQHAERAQERRGQIGTGERSERIRTYNFPQNRVTDHRIDLTLYRLEQVLDGDLDDLIDGLAVRAETAELS
jgi:peptide chain release factor 1